MDKSMLMRELEPGPNSSFQEDFVMVMATLKGCLQFVDALHIMNISAGNIAEFQKDS